MIERRMVVAPGADGGAPGSLDGEHARAGDWSVSDIPSMTGRLALVTGGTRGIGHHIAAALAGAGADVIIAARSAENGNAALDRIVRSRPRRTVRCEPLDLARLQSVRALAERLVSEGRPLDLLVNNAAILAPRQRRVTEDEFEAQFQINYLGHFALTALLLPLLRQAPAPRVTHVSSLAHHQGRMNFDDLQATKTYRPMTAYSQSKLANLLFAFELQRRSIACGWGLTSNAAHPGFSRTNLVAHSRGHDDFVARMIRWMGPLLTQPAAAGALPLLYAATATDAEAMGYYGPKRLFGVRGPVSPARVAAGAKDEHAARTLWEVSEALSMVSFPAE